MKIPIMEIEVAFDTNRDGGTSLLINLDQLLVSKEACLYLSFRFIGLKSMIIRVVNLSDILFFRTRPSTNFLDNKYVI